MGGGMLEVWNMNKKCACAHKDAISCNVSTSSRVLAECCCECHRTHPAPKAAEREQFDAGKTAGRRAVVSVYADNYLGDWSGKEESEC